MIIYKKFTINFLWIVLGLISFVLGTNYFIDPAHEFYKAGDFERKIAGLMLANKPAETNENYSHRLVKKFVIERLTTHPDILVLGSSRMRGITKETVNDANIFNAWVPGASIEDDIVLYFLYQQHGLKPEIVILGLDPWLLNKNNGQERWKEYSENFTNGLKMLGIKPQSSSFKERVDWLSQKYLQLFSWDYTVLSVKTLYNNKDKEIKYTNDSAASSILLSKKAADEAGLLYAQQTPVYSLKAFSVIDDRNRELLEHFIAYLELHNVKVILYLPPYQRKAYEGIVNNKNYKMVNAAEEYYLTLSQKYHLKIIGAYNPKALHLEANDFIDGMHLQPKAFNKIFSQYQNWRQH